MTRVASELRVDFSLVHEDLPFRLQRRLGLVPRHGLGVVRRAVILALVTWLPMAVWALLEGRALPGRTGEPLLQHFGIHVRCLVAIPLFIIGEATSYGVATQFLRRLLAGGFVTKADMPRLEGILAQAIRLRNGWLPWVVVASLVIGWAVWGPTLSGADDLNWAATGDSVKPSLGFGGWWFLYVVRFVFLTLLLAWIWRLILWCIVLWRVMRLDLALVPTHPDGVMGLGYLERTPAAFQPFLFAISSVVAASWAHETLYHGVDVRSFAAPAAAFAVVAVGLVLAPLLTCVGSLTRAKREAMAGYSALVAEHGRLVRERWIEGREPADTRLLEAEELGPVADTITLFEAVRRTRPVPISRKTLIMILVPLAIPMVALIATQVPINEILKVLLKALV